MRYGTANFVSRKAAESYYAQYSLSPRAVARKLADGEIFIGPPSLKPGQTLEYCDNGLRYAIRESI